jgi:chromodomain-helicase-DNA-binding protein 4
LLRPSADTDYDIDQLIEKTQTATPEEETTKDGGLSFSFAKIWAADKDSLEELADDLPTNQPSDSWEQTLRRIETEIQKEKAKEVTGRGVRRKATAAVFSKVTPQVMQPKQSLHVRTKP